MLSKCTGLKVNLLLMHRIESKFVTGPSNILSAGVCMSTFQPGNFTGLGSEGVKEGRLNERMNAKLYSMAHTNFHAKPYVFTAPLKLKLATSKSSQRHRVSHHHHPPPPPPPTAPSVFNLFIVHVHGQRRPQTDTRVSGLGRDYRCVRVWA